MTEEDFVELAVEGARNYANRWSIERWHAYLWMLEDLLLGRKFFVKL